MFAIAIGVVIYANRPVPDIADNPNPSPRKKTPGTGELENNTVTVSLLQLVLLAQAPQLQQTLTTLATEADTSTSNGLAAELQEVVLTLLRLSAYWSHCRTLSETFNDRDQAAQYYQQLSLEERTKFSKETFTHVNGKVRQSSLEDMPNLEEELPEYIVVTLLMGTENDHPLLDKIYDTEAVAQALRRLGSITPNYLALFELLWSPQSREDSLTSEELLLEYPGLIQL